MGVADREDRVPGGLDTEMSRETSPAEYLLDCFPFPTLGVPLKQADSRLPTRAVPLRRLLVHSLSVLARSDFSGHFRPYLGRYRLSRTHGVHSKRYAERFIMTTSGYLGGMNGLRGNARLSMSA